jgi:hypothetical protein
MRGLTSKFFHEGYLKQISKKKNKDGQWDKDGQWENMNPACIFLILDQLCNFVYSTTAFEKNL